MSKKKKAPEECNRILDAARVVFEKNAEAFHTIKDYMDVADCLFNEVSSQAPCIILRRWLVHRKWQLLIYSDEIVRWGDCRFAGAGSTLKQLVDWMVYFDNSDDDSRLAEIAMHRARGILSAMHGYEQVASP